MATIILQQTEITETFNVGCSGRSACTNPSGRQMSEGGVAGSFQASAGLTNLASLVAGHLNISDAIGETVWASGNYTTRLSTSSSANSLTLEEVHVCHYDVSGDVYTSLGSNTGLGIGLSVTGVQTEIVNCSAASSPDIADKLAIIWVFSNSSAHGPDGSVNIVPSELIHTPIEKSVPELSMPRLNQRVARYLTR